MVSHPEGARRRTSSAHEEASSFIDVVGGKVLVSSTRSLVGCCFIACFPMPLLYLDPFWQNTFVVHQQLPRR